MTCVQAITQTWEGIIGRVDTGVGVHMRDPTSKALCSLLLVCAVGYKTSRPRLELVSARGSSKKNKFIDEMIPAPTKYILNGTCAYAICLPWTSQSAATYDTSLRRPTLPPNKFEIVGRWLGIALATLALDNRYQHNCSPTSRSQMTDTTSTNNALDCTGDQAGTRPVEGFLSSTSSTTMHGILHTRSRTVLADEAKHTRLVYVIPNGARINCEVACREKIS